MSFSFRDFFLVKQYHFVPSRYIVRYFFFYYFIEEIRIEAS